LISQILVMPQNVFYSHPMIANLSQMFERYRMKTKLEFKATVNTATTGVIKFAYYEDPVALFEQTGKNGTNTASFKPVLTDMFTTGDVSMNQSCVEATVWKSFQTGWSWIARGQEMRYTGALTYNGVMAPGDIEAIDIRQPAQGMWALTSAGLAQLSADSQTRLGELWIHFTIELCDILSAKVLFNPSLTGAQTTWRRPISHVTTRKSDALEKKVSRLEELFKGFSIPEEEDKKEKEKESKTRTGSRDSQRARSPFRSDLSVQGVQAAGLEKRAAQ